MRTNSFKYSIHERETKRNGTLYDVFFRIEGRQVKLSGFKTKTQARQAFNNYMEDYLTKPKYDIHAQHLMYEDARRLYFESVKRTLKESSIYDFMCVAEKYTDVYFARKDLMCLTKKDVMAFLDWLWSRKRPDGEYYSQRYLDKIYHQFAAFYHWCMQRYELPDVLSGLALPKKKQQVHEYEIWTVEEFEQFISVADNDKYKALFTLLFYSGLRVGEAQSLKVGDYDGKEVFVYTTYSKKTLDGSSYNITETKNYKERHVPLPKACTDVLDEWVKGRPKDGFMFGLDRPPAYTPISNAFKRYIEESGVKRIRIHDMRHSYVSNIHARGASLVTTAALIGDTPKQVAETYAHVFKDDMQKFVDLL